MSSKERSYGLYLGSALVALPLTVSLAIPTVSGWVR
jgi:hypothetical protein